MHYSLSIIFCLSVLSASVVMAAAPVVDIDNRIPAPTSGPAVPPQDLPIGSTASQPPAQGIFSQVQQLQDEVRELRGLVEEQANEIRLLKKRQLDDYQNLDGRINGLRGGSVAPGEAVSGGSADLPTEHGGNEPIDARDSGGLGGESSLPGSVAGREVAGSGPTDSTADPEYQHYSAAYDLLKSRRIEEAGTKFREYLASYPNGNYAANAHYWLGEISLLENKLEVARKEFSIVLEKYPGDRKAEDAGFKLGKVYHLLGDNARAKTQLTKTAAGTGTAARLAQSYLQENF